jgi:hypothetical protein
MVSRSSAVLFISAHMVAATWVKEGVFGYPENVSS